MRKSFWYEHTVCMYVCMYVRIYVCTVCMYVSRYIYIQWYISSATIWKFTQTKNGILVTRKASHLYKTKVYTVRTCMHVHTYGQTLFSRAELILTRSPVAISHSQTIRSMPPLSSLRILMYIINNYYLCICIRITIAYNVCIEC